MAVVIEISERYERAIAREVAEGRFEDAGDVVSAALDAFFGESPAPREPSVEELASLAAEGIASGPSIPADRVFDRLLEKYRALVQDRGE